MIASTSYMAVFQMFFLLFSLYVKCLNCSNVINQYCLDKNRNQKPPVSKTVPCLQILHIYVQISLLNALGYGCNTV